MTSLAAALAIDARGPAALYMIADSRISWEDVNKRTIVGRWDWGRKTFRSPSSPDIFGYCGDAYFVPVILSQIVDLVALNVIRLDGLSADRRHQVVFDCLERAIAESPEFAGDVSVFHGARDNEFMSSKFRLWRMRFDKNSRKWCDEELALNDTESYFAHLDGTGASHVQRVQSQSLGAPGTSRAAIFAFTQSLRSGTDPYSGGAPQLVGIWRRGTARQFGFCWNGRPYICGLQVPLAADFTQVDWFNHLFERCDGKTGSKLKGATSHRASLNPRKRRQ
jgi:hypothetical protein